MEEASLTMPETMRMLELSNLKSDPVAFCEMIMGKPLQHEYQRKLLENLAVIAYPSMPKGKILLSNCTMDIDFINSILQSQEMRVGIFIPNNRRNVKERWRQLAKYERRMNYSV